MKKNFICLFVVLLLPLIFLAGCGRNERLSLDERIGEAGQEYPTSFEGVLERLDSLDVYQQGTHQLTTEDQETIILQSSTIDLNRYLGENVLVKGTLEKGVGEMKDVFTVKGVSFLDESKGAEMKDYENKSFGFKFSYPSTWILNAESDGLSLSLDENKLVGLTVYSEESDLDAFVSSREKDASTEVTIGAQRALRFTAEEGLRFYVPNPPKKKIYVIEYTSSINPVDDQEGADSEKSLFYDLLDSFELIYLSQTEGEKCGGAQELQCPEEQVCQLDSDEKFAEGVCVPVGGEASQANCPFIAPPTGCQQYRISEYSLKGCPTRYECLEGGEGAESVPYRDVKTDTTVEKSSDELTYDEQFDETDDGTAEENANPDAVSDEEAEYTVPDLSKVTGVYANARRGFSLLYPKSWYYASFGPIDGTLWKVGFSDKEFEDPKDAIIMLSLTEESGGDASKKIGNVYYIFDGPSDLSAVMEKMADSVEESQ